MSDKYSPQEALQHYFDDLLAGEENPVTRYADPDLVQQQKLEKLLQSARPHVGPPPSPCPSAPFAEIQALAI